MGKDSKNTHPSTSAQAVNKPGIPRGYGLLPVCIFGLALVLVSCSPQPTGDHTQAAPSPTRTAIQLPSAIAPTETPALAIDTTKTPICDQTQGSLVESRYPGVISPEEIRVLVQLPPCYEESAEEYPVLYLLHGYPLDESHWLDLGIVEAAEQAYLEGYSPHFLMVFPYIPPDLNVNTDGGDGSYEEEFIEGVVNFIEGNYRILQGAEYTALAGVSRGGVWSLEIGLRHADQIGTIASLSPALHVNHPRPAYDPFSLIQDPAYRPERLFISIGTDEDGFYQKTVEFATLVGSLGIKFQFLETAGAHVNSTWSAIMQDVLKYVSAAW